MKKVTEREKKKVNYRGEKEKKKSRKNGSISIFFSFRLETLAGWLVILVNITTVPPSSGDDVMMLYRSVVLGRYIHIYTYIQQYTARN